MSYRLRGAVSLCGCELQSRQKSSSDVNLLQPHGVVDGRVQRGDAHRV